MNLPSLRELEQLVDGQVSYDAALAGLTTYRIGGPASALVDPRSTGDVVAIVRFAAERGVPWLALGLGSNVLVSDRGFPGVVVRLGKWMSDLAVADEDHVWRVGAGMPTPLLARRTADAGLAGVHRLIGVPGTVGGGVVMNAGAHGQDFRSIARSVELVQENGDVVVRPASDVAWAYRSSGLGHVVVTQATLAFERGEPSRLRHEISEHFRWRKAGTPFNEPCCGSVFRNPTPGDGARRTAGQLVHAAGLKGFRIGGAEVSTRHANYIVNVGGASSDDVRRVIDAVRARVLAEFGVELELEVRMIGE